MPFDTQLETAFNQNQAHQLPRAAEATPASDERLFLLLSSRGALYAIEAARVRELHGLPAFGVLPQSPRGVAGVANVRGEVLPVIDLSQRLGHEPLAPRLSDALIVLQETRPYALWVDEVRDIVSLKESDLEAAPFSNEYSLVSHMTHLGGEVVLLLQTSRLLENIEVADELDASLHLDVFSTVEEAEQKVFRLRAQLLSQSLVQETTPSHKLALAATTPKELASGNATQENFLAVARVVISGEERGVVLSQVREFCALESFTPVPCCPPHIVGQMNLRGEVVTLLDLAPRLGVRAFDKRAIANHDFAKRAEKSSTTTISTSAPAIGQVVVVNGANTTESSGFIGVVVDEILDVIHAREEQFRAVEATQSDAYCGLILHGDKALYILNLTSLVAERSWIVDQTV